MNINSSINTLKYKLKYNSQFRNIIFLYFIGIILWLSIVFYREYYNKDVLILRKNFIDKCNGWCVGHFFHYMLLGYFAPVYWKYLIIIGIIFELIEIPLNKLSKFIDGKLIQDPITNSLGVFTGLILYNLYPNNIDFFSFLNI